LEEPRLPVVQGSLWKQEEELEIEGNRRGGERGKKKEECEMGCVEAWGVF